jgi:lipopolysaccharide transport system ATP-binding protein
VLTAAINDEMGQRVLVLRSDLIGIEIPDLKFGQQVFRFTIPKMPLVPGRYRLTLRASINGDCADWIVNASAFDVEVGDYYGTGRLPQGMYGAGLFLVDHTLSFAKGADNDIPPKKGVPVSSLDCKQTAAQTKRS